ncbi:malonate decarboxylase subunit delta [Cupriavidus sp. 30B13]|uniref:malonate decarboxylase subunit delta n=1 Tax=Cupriavidus sp. 30B13 TaxID=3384241 RepID=UPI003CF14296
MEQLQFEYPAGAPAGRRVLVGVVGSGDLEVMVEPGSAGTTVIDVTTSVDGYGKVWDAQLARVFGAEQRAAMRIRIHDFGATPGVVGMRLAEAFEALDASSRGDDSNSSKEQP